MESTWFLILVSLTSTLSLSSLSSFSVVRVQIYKAAAEPDGILEEVVSEMDMCGKF